MMGEEDRNPEIIRKESKELSNIRKEQQIMRVWVGVLLGANLLLLGGFLWVSGRDQGTKQPVTPETDFQFPTSVPPAEEDSNIWIAADIVPNDTNNTDSVSNTDNVGQLDDAEHVDNTDDTDNMYADTAVDEMDNTNNTEDYTEDTDNMEKSPLPPVAVNPVTAQRPTARTVRTAVQPRRKKTAVTIPACIITRPGMTLRSLARFYYGSQVFWIYIYDRNMRVLSSIDTSLFDALPSGIQLELPRPAEYEIDATEPISLQRACNLAKKLAKQ